MTVTDTSREAYHLNEERFDTLREMVLYIVANAHHPSASDISRIGNLRINTVTGRLNELEKDNLIHKVEKKIDPFTGNRVYYYAVGGKAE